MSHFHSLKVKQVIRETKDSVSVSFHVSDDLASIFQFQSGQYLTLRALINGEDVRRSYSLCSAPHEGEYRIAAKEVEGGRMSSWLNRDVYEGMTIEVMPPQGNFLLGEGKKHAAFAAGSGITPILSMIKSVLKDDHDAHFVLFYGNRDLNGIMFKEEMLRLQESSGRLHVYHVLSREKAESPLLEGRISKDKVMSLLQQYGGLGADQYYLCGPGDMIMSVADTLKANGIAADRIRYELFTTPVNEGEVHNVDAHGSSEVTVVMDGLEYVFPLEMDGEFILDAAMEAGVDAPFSCKGAVCCTCKAKVIEGTAEMEMNYALTDSEVEEGYILTCQAHPTSEKVKIDYDVV